MTNGIEFGTSRDDIPFAAYERRAETMTDARKLRCMGALPCWARGPQATEDDFLDVIAELAAAPGLEFVNVHADSVDEFVQCYDEACSFICDRTRHPQCPRCGHSVPEWCDDPAYSLKGVCRLLSDASAILRCAGKNLYVENYREPPELMSRVFASLPPEIGFTLDVGHANLMGFAPANYIDVLGHRLRHLHLHDNHGGGRSTCDEHLTPGQGDIDWNALAFALARVGFAGTTTFECAPPSREWIKNWSRSISGDELVHG